MFRSLSLGCVLASVSALLAACSSDPAPVDTPNPMGGGNAGATTQQGGSAGSGAGTPATVAGSSSGGMMGSSGSAGQPGMAGGGAAAGGMAGGGGGAGGGGALPMGPFTCTMFLGLLTTNEWYSQGFEEGVDGTKYELKYHHYAYVRTWGDPNSPFWGETGNSFDLDQGSQIQSPCAMNPTAPDRMVFAALDWEMETKEEWKAALEMALGTFKGKYPSLKRIDIMTLIRCPDNSMCNANADYGPGANMNAGRQDCYIPDYQDAAIAEVAAAHPDFVAVGPKVEAIACRQPVDGAHLSGDANEQAAKDVAAYYAQHP
jgi:hypothetical protein